MDPPQVWVYDRPTTWVVCARKRWIMNYMESCISIIMNKHTDFILNYIVIQCVHKKKSLNRVINSVHLKIIFRCHINSYIV